MAGVKEVGVHVKIVVLLTAVEKKTDPLGRTSSRW